MLVEQLRALGVPRGGVLLVHSAFSKVGPIEGGPRGLIFWRMPGVLRSDSPHAFAASGPHASHITKPHPVDVPRSRDIVTAALARLRQDETVFLRAAGACAECDAAREGIPL